jgi:hypothetical protein
LIKASTCPAAALSAEVLAGAEVEAVAVAVADWLGCADGADRDAVAEADGDADADGPDLGLCARLAAMCAGIVTRTGGAATATAVWFAAQELVPAVPHPAVMLPVRPATAPAACPAVEWEVPSPRVR